MNELIVEKLILVNNEVDTMLSTSPLLIRSYMKHLAKAKGKGIRACAVLISAMDQESMISEDAIHFASAIELLHLASLVHDDVMDDASVRRGISTLNEKYGRKTAVICGDYVLALAMSTMNKVKDRNRYTGMELSQTMQELALGELNQHINNGNLNISVKDYLDIIRGKTAALFEASFYLGAMTIIDDAEMIDKYKRFGNNVGMIFQLMDDCIDYSFTQEEALKPVASDFEQGVITLPLIHALDSEPDLRTQPLTRETVLDRVKRYHGVLFTQRKAETYYQEALNLLDTMELTKTKYQEMQFVLDKAMQKQ